MKGSQPNTSLHQGKRELARDAIRDFLEYLKENLQRCFTTQEVVEYIKKESPEVWRELESAYPGPEFTARGFISTQLRTMPEVKRSEALGCRHRRYNAPGYKCFVHSEEGWGHPAVAHWTLVEV